MQTNLYVWVYFLFQSVEITDRCWGYEPHCTKEKAYSYPECPGHHKGWVKSKEAQYETFYKQADFGYVKEQREELTMLCKPTSEVSAFMLILCETQ